MEPHMIDFVELPRRGGVGCVVVNHVGFIVKKYLKIW